MNKNKGILIISSPDGGVNCKAISKSTISVGRSTSNDIVINSPMVSAKHGTFSYDGRVVSYLDSGSNGTYLNGKKIGKNNNGNAKPVVIKDGYKLSFPAQYPDQMYSIYYAAFDERVSKWNRIDVAKMPSEILVGRDSKNVNIYISDNKVSRKHAKIIRTNGKIFISDMSSNGTLINGVRVSGSQEVFDGDVIRLGDNTMFYVNGILLYPYYKKPVEPVISENSYYETVVDLPEEEIEPEKAHALRPMSSNGSNFVRKETKSSGAGLWAVAMVAVCIVVALIVYLIVRPSSSNMQSTVHYEDLYCDVMDVYIGESADATFTVQIHSGEQEIGVDDVTLNNGTEIVGYFNDTGIEGDAVAHDGIYTCKATLSSAVECIVDYYVSALGCNSETWEVAFYDFLTQEEFDTFFVSRERIQRAVQPLLTEAGEVNAENLEQVLSVVETTTQALCNEGTVSEYTTDNKTIWMRFTSGIQLVYSPAIPGYDTGNGSVSIVTCQPYDDDYGTSQSTEVMQSARDATDGSARRIDEKYVNYTFTNEYNNEDVNLDVIKNFGENQIILWHGHGGYSEQLHSFLGLNVDIDYNDVMNDSTLSADFASGRIVLLNGGGIGITHRFVDYYVSSMQGSFIYLGTCSSGKDNALANSFIRKGVSAVIANSDVIKTVYNYGMIKNTMDGLMNISNETGLQLTLKDAVAYAKGIMGENDGDETPAYPIIFQGNDYRLLGELGGDISGVIYGIKGAETNPISNAKITLTNPDGAIFEAISDSEGKYIINDAMPSTYQVKITAEGYKELSLSKELSINENTSFYLDDMAVSSLVGRITIADRDMNFTNNLPLENAKITIKKLISSSTIKFNTTTDANGEYYFENLSSGIYKVTVAKDGYISAEQKIVIQPDQTSYYNTMIEAIADSFLGAGTASGKIYDAVTGDGVSGITLNIRKGLGNTEGEIVSTITTNEAGEYITPELETGHFCVEIVDERANITEENRYISSFMNIKILGGISVENQDGAISTALYENQLRIVLRWGESPRDIDSHLVGPVLNSSEQFHVFFNDKTEYYDDVIMADLDLDDTTSYGPETTTIYNSVEGVYRFSVHNYSDRGDYSSTTLSQSGAYIEVYKGTESVASYVFSVPYGVGTIWNVFDYDSRTNTIIPINQINSETSSMYPNS
ncbi:MAG: carboxypeptidase regulatory-like domain-containing protein [Clostridia bacterium]|nr:carboxypeptidase regulatory-like domain-containing protein [Clostridia bacterium]